MACNNFPLGVNYFIKVKVQQNEPLSTQQRYMYSDFSLASWSYKGTVEVNEQGPVEKLFCFLI